jgi:hypothetical protein
MSMDGHFLRYSRYGALPRLPAPLDHMCWIFPLPASDARHRRDSIWCGCQICSWAAALVNDLESGFAKRYTIVNGGQALEDKVRLTTSKALQLCTSITKEQYFTQFDWQDVFTHEEVDEWSKKQ